MVAGYTPSSGLNSNPTLSSKGPWEAPETSSSSFQNPLTDSVLFACVVCLCLSSATSPAVPWGRGLLSSASPGTTSHQAKGSGAEWSWLSRTLLSEGSQFPVCKMGVKRPPSVSWCEGERKLPRWRNEHGAWCIGPSRQTPPTLNTRDWRHHRPKRLPLSYFPQHSCS